MSSTLGQPGFVASNRTGQSGVSQSNIGSLGSGILQTIEEGVGAQMGDVFYYDKSVVAYQLPSVQRSHGDDYKSINITTFGSRGTVTLPRKFFNFGPSALRFRLPINYAWSGCEYTTNFYEGQAPVTTLQIAENAAGGLTVANGATYNIARYTASAHQLNKNQFMFESPGCPTMLPTSFQSGGMAFAFPQQIELNMGGAGTIQFDRYANWVAIMASCPTIELRKTLMRMAGGGLCLDNEQEAKTAPVRWGLISYTNASGYSNSKSVFRNTGAAGAITTVTSNPTADDVDRKKLVPIEWDVLLPIKTPETNFMYSLERRKPLDTSCFASDLQITFTWSNFNEYTDTGKGYPNAPVYASQRVEGVDDGDSQVLDVLVGDIGKQGHRTPFTGRAPLGYNTINTSDANFVPFYEEIGAPTKVCLNFDVIPAIGAAAFAGSYMFMQSPLVVNPKVWTNHYRVASGAPLKSEIHYNTNDVSYKWRANDGTVIAGQTTPVGRCRLPQFIHPVADTDRIYTSLQRCADDVNSFVSYPTGFSSVEYINSSLKLTNPALGAYNALRVAKEAVLYYPFQHFYSQIYRIKTNPYSSMNTITSANLKTFSSQLSDLYSESNKMTQLIQMPANPCTALFVAIFREKDRIALTQGKLNSYSPVLFWNALNPLRMVLKDAGNTLFDYRNNIDFEYYSLMDRPDALKIPFRGGHVQVPAKNIYGNRYSAESSSNQTVGRFTTKDATATYTTVDPYGAVHAAAASRPELAKPLWYKEIGGLAGGGALPTFGKGFRGMNNWISGGKGDHPSDSVNAFPADDLVSVIGLTNGLRNGTGEAPPCHTTEWYEASIIEFPLVMAEPITSEKIVQQTPSFAKTQLQLDFWIDPKLKADNGMDDMYDQTYGLTRACPQGVLGIKNEQVLGEECLAMGYPSPVSHPVPDCLHEGRTDPASTELSFRDLIQSAPARTGVSAVIDTNGYSKYADGFDFTKVSSWNVNNGDLMLHITFCQNQVWTISPLRTSLLSARG
jgi:hypothetical protein